MGADIKSIKNRIRSIDSTLHVTKAMQLVASSKIKRAAEAASGASSYSDAVCAAMHDIVSPETAGSVFVVPKESGKTLIVAVAGDRGLAGGYNSNIIKLLTAEIAETDAAVLPVGRRIYDYCVHHGISLFDNVFRSSEKLTDNGIREISGAITEKFTAGEYRAVKVLGTRPVNVLTQTAEIKTVLPLERAGNGSPQTVFEPDAETVMNSAIPDYLTAVICAEIRKSFLSELYARRNAMDSATKNASEMIDRLNLSYNRARQSSITQEITEIVAGAENQ